MSVLTISPAVLGDAEKQPPSLSRTQVLLDSQDSECKRSREERLAAHVPSAQRCLSRAGLLSPSWGCQDPQCPPSAPSVRCECGGLRGQGLTDLEGCSRAGKLELPSHQLQRHLRAEPTRTGLNELPVVSFPAGFQPGLQGGSGAPPVLSLRLPGSLVRCDCSGSCGAPGTLLQPLLVSVTPHPHPATPGTGSSGPKATLS